MAKAGLIGRALGTDEAGGKRQWVVVGGIAMVDVRLTTDRSPLFTVL
jgi:hypothetical protein